MRTISIHRFGRAFLACAAAALLAAVAARPARAQDPPGGGASLPGGEVGDRPWAKGVTPEQEKRALALNQEANTLLAQSIFVPAVEKYREALAIYDHPAIHYNLALALLVLDKPEEIYEHLVAATRYGAGPLLPGNFEHAVRYRDLTERQLARVTISSALEGVQVTVDGVPVRLEKGRWTGRLRAGTHAVVATKEGYVPSQRQHVLPPGEETKIELTLFTAGDLTRYRRRWSAWKPWAVTGAGAVVLGVGGYLTWSARDSFQAYDAGVVDCGGCVPDSALADLKSRGELRQTLAGSAYAVGGAAIVAGVGLVYLNRLTPYRLSPEDGVQVGAAPIVGSRGRGGAVTATFRF